MKIIWILLVQGLALVASQSTTPKPTVISGAQFGLLEDFSPTEGMVYHLEEDQSRSGFIMFSDGASLKTTNGQITYTIVGKADSTGYLEGYGSSARFGWITGFTQLNETHVVIVDYSNHCLRIIDRTKNLSSRFVGQCTSSGSQNGLEAYFHNPWSVIKDASKKKSGTSHQWLLVTDSKNQAVRYVDVQFRSVFTYLDVRNGLNFPYGITFDQRVANLFTTNFNYVMAHNAKDESDITITGNSDKGFKDGKIADAQFGVPAEIISLRDHLFLLADQDNNVIRLLDFKGSSVSSICRRGNGTKSVNGNAMSCLLNKPRGLLLATDNYVYIGQLQSIKRIRVTLPANEIPPVLPGTSLSGCPNTNGTFRLENGKTTVQIELVPGYIFSLSAGEHEIFIQKENCTVVINVEPEFPDKGQGCPPEQITKRIPDGNNTVEVELYTDEYFQYSEGTYQYRTQNCTTNITILAPIVAPNGTNNTYQCSDQTLVIRDREETATYTESLDGITHAIELPVGEHEISIQDGDQSCNKTVTVVDYRLKRRLLFKANYDITCVDIPVNSTEEDVVKLTAESKFVQIKDLCPKTCEDVPAEPVRVECNSSSTDIIWPTNIVYSGNDTSIPQKDLDKFKENLANSKNILDVVVTKKTPPVVYPNKVNNMTVNVFLETYCLDKKTYNNTLDSCTD